MATQTFEFMLGTTFLVCGAAFLLFRRYLADHFSRDLEHEEVFDGITVLQFYSGVGVGTLLLGSVLLLTAFIAYA